MLTAPGARGRGLAVAVFVLQLALNLAWSPLFFGAHQISGALMLIGGLDVLVLLCVALFARVRPMAAVLLLPYLGWALFATVLNWQFLTLNPGADGQVGASPDAGPVVRVQIGG